MTRDDIIRMAREAGWNGHDAAFDTRIERFAKLVAAAERDACAQIAFNAKTYIQAANTIRLRGVRHEQL